MSTETSDSPAESPGTSLPTDDADGSTSTSAKPSKWHNSIFGIGIVGVDVALMLAIAASTTSRGDHLIPWEVYMFGALGALGYVFRSLLHDFDKSAKEVLQVNVQVLAAIPLAAGIYLFADLAQSSEPNLEFVAGISFIVGLFVDLAYQTLSTIANKVFKGLAGGRSSKNVSTPPAGGQSDTSDGRSSAPSDTSDSTSQRSSEN